MPEVLRQLRILLFSFAVCTNSLSYLGSLFWSSGYPGLLSALLPPSLCAVCSAGLSAAMPSLSRQPNCVSTDITGLKTAVPLGTAVPGQTALLYYAQCNVHLGAMRRARLA